MTRTSSPALRPLRGLLPALFITGWVPAAAAQRVEIPGRQCSPQTDAIVPPLAAVFDSAVGLKALTEVPGNPWGQAVISFVFSPEGAAGRARVLATDLPDSSAARVLRAVASAIKDLEHPGLPGTRLLVSTGGTPTVRVEAAVYCPPEPESRDPAVRTITVMSTKPPPAVRKPIRIHFLVVPTGQVENVELVDGSGIDELDRDVIEHARQQRFKPALIDGIPVTVWVNRP